MAYGGGLENRYGVTPIVGSNPTPSAADQRVCADPSALSAGRPASPPGYVLATCPYGSASSRREVPEAGRNVGIAPLGRVRVDHCRAGRQVAGAPHDLGEGRPALRRQGETCMPQVVQMDVGQAGCSPGCAPGGMDVMGAEGSPVSPHEQPSRWQRRGAGLQMLGQCRDALWREVDDALATHLRWALHGAGVRLDDLPLHGDGAVVHVDVADAESQQLAEAQVSPEGQVDEAPEVLRHVGG